MEIRVKWENEPEVTRRIKMKMDKLGGIVREAMREAAEETSEFILFRGAEDIQEAGNFGSDWVDALHADITETQRTIRIEAGMQPQGPPVTYWQVFEYGATIFAHNPTGFLFLQRDGNIFAKVPQVTIPKKFHLMEIIKDEAKKAGAAFKRILDEKKAG